MLVFKLQKENKTKDCPSYWGTVFSLNSNQIAGYYI